MSKFMQAAIAGVALSAVVAGGSAQVNAAACTSGASVDSLVGSSCTFGDATFSLTSETLGASATLNFLFFNGVYALNVQNINLGSGNSATFNYTLAMDKPLELEITSISVDSDVQPAPGQVPGGSTVTKDVKDAADALIGQIVSTNGGGPVVLNGFGESVIKVFETFNATGGQTIFSASNGIVQTAVPEPVGLSLLGAGLIGLGFAGRRRKAA